MSSEMKMPLPLTLQSTPSDRLASAPDLDSADDEHPNSNGSSFQYSTVHQDIDDLSLPSNIDEDEENSASNDGSFQKQMDIGEEFYGPSPNLADEERRFSFATSYQHADVYGGDSFGDSWAAEDEERPVSCAGTFKGANVLNDVTVDQFYMTDQDFHEAEPRDEDEYEHKPAGTDLSLIHI